jgi:uncharacterized membrane protein (DUF485 family)
MAGFDHPPSTHEEVRDPVVETHNARLGLFLFAIYLLAYGAYVLINAFWPALMDAVLFAGMNLAVLSGLGLILFALMLAICYALLCRSPGRNHE